MLRAQLTTIDVGNLLVEDLTPLQLPKGCSPQERDSKLMDVCTENMQLLVDDLWKIPSRREGDAVVVSMPDGKTLLPREKAIPKAKPETRWEKFAKLKGITKTKKGRMEWDEASKDWVPRWGLGSKKNAELKQWLVEVPQSVDPNTDMFEKMKTEKKERKAKNELNRLKNIARSMKGKAAAGVLPGTTSKNGTGDQPKSTGLAKALSVAQVSDASMGQFSKKLPDENKKRYAKGGQKRKLDSSSTFSAEAETKRAMTVIAELKRQGDKVDKNKAANRLQVEKETKRRKEKEEGGDRKKGKLLSEMVSKRKINKKQGAKKFKNRYSRTGKKKK